MSPAILLENRGRVWLQGQILGHLRYIFFFIIVITALECIKKYWETIFGESRFELDTPLWDKMG